MIPADFGDNIPGDVNVLVPVHLFRFVALDSQMPVIAHDLASIVFHGKVHILLGMDIEFFTLVLIFKSNFIEPFSAK